MKVITDEGSTLSHLIIIIIPDVNGAKELIEGVQELNIIYTHIDGTGANVSGSGDIYESINLAPSDSC